MSKPILFSPPYVDKDGAYGRDFYWEERGGFGRVRALDTLHPTTEVDFTDSPDLGKATFSREGYTHVDVIDCITFEPEQPVTAGVLMSVLQNKRTEDGRN